MLWCLHNQIVSGRYQRWLLCFIPSLILEDQCNYIVVEFQKQMVISDYLLQVDLRTHCYSVFLSSGSFGPQVYQPFNHIVLQVSKSLWPALSYWPLLKHFIQHVLWSASLGTSNLWSYCPPQRQEWVLLKTILISLELPQVYCGCSWEIGTKVLRFLCTGDPYYVLYTALLIS